MTKSNGTVDITTNGWDEVRAGFAKLGRLSREVNGTARVCHDHDIAGRITQDRWTLPGDTLACGSDAAGSESFTLLSRYNSG